MGSRRRVSPRQADEEILEALNELFEAFVVDNERLSDWQLRASRAAERVLAPHWRRRRGAARATARRAG